MDSFELMNKKEIRCRECNSLVDFISDLYDETIKNPTCDGINVICPICGYEDDISQLYVTFKDGGIMNMQDYYADCTSVYKKDIDDKQLYKEFNILKNRRKK